jgi:hypothetical protein
MGTALVRATPRPRQGCLAPPLPRACQALLLPAAPPGPRCAPCPRPGRIRMAMRMAEGVGARASMHWPHWHARRSGRARAPAGCQKNTPHPHHPHSAVPRASHLRGRLPVEGLRRRGQRRPPVASGVGVGWLGGRGGLVTGLAGGCVRRGSVMGRARLADSGCSHTIDRSPRALTCINVCCECFDARGCWASSTNRMRRRDGPEGCAGRAGQGGRCHTSAH